MGNLIFIIFLLVLLLVGFFGFYCHTQNRRKWILNDTYQSEPWYIGNMTLEYGPDCSSTPEAIAETNAHEELNQIKENIELLIEELKAKPHLTINRQALINELEKMIGV